MRKACEPSESAAGAESVLSGESRVSSQQSSYHLQKRLAKHFLVASDGFNGTFRNTRNKFFRHQTSLLCCVSVSNKSMTRQNAIRSQSAVSRQALQTAPAWSKPPRFLHCTNLQVGTLTHASWKRLKRKRHVDVQI